MASWITDEKGLWHPAKERVSLKNLSGKKITVKQVDKEGKEFVQDILPGDDYIYEGPCRAALLELWLSHGKPTEAQMNDKEKVLTFGEDFRRNPEFLESYARARQAFGFGSVDEYLNYIGYDDKKVKQDFIEKASVVKRHELPSQVSAIQRLGGGKDTAGQGKLDKYGGFGEPEEVATAR